MRQRARSPLPLALLAVAACAGIFLFYWYELRPIRVYRRCSIEASADARALLTSKAELATGPEEAQYRNLLERGMYLRSDYESFLHKCLLYYGLPEALGTKQYPADAVVE